MTIKKETIDGVDYVRKDVLVSFLGELCKGCIADAVGFGEWQKYTIAGALQELRSFFQEL